MVKISASIIFALLSAVLFGLATPISKILLQGVTPFQLAGLLYLGAAVGLFPVTVTSGALSGLRGMSSSNKLRLLGAVFFGGMAGPVALLFGLQLASASSVSLWLNLELVFTALLGHFFFQDRLGKLGWLGSLGVVTAAVLLVLGAGISGIKSGIFVGLACLFWGFDNHFTALIDEIPPSANTFFKGVVAGTVNLVIGLFLSSYGAGLTTTGLALVLGAFSYGVSIVLYISSAQGLGATRAQMIFASAPFFGVTLSVLVLNETLSLLQIAAAVLLFASVIPLLLDSHTHEHVHKNLTHEHLHRHAEGHHEHSHASGWFLDLIPHLHEHEHEELDHEHPHLPDIHHRHEHEEG